MEIVERAVPTWLAPFCRGEISGWVMRSTEPLRDGRPAFGGLPLVVSFGPTIRVSRSACRPSPLRAA